MKYIGWFLFISTAVFHWKAASYYENKILDMKMTLDVIYSGKRMKLSLVKDLSDKYEGCLGREKKLQMFFRRKVENYRKIAKLNKERIEKWQRKEKPSILAHYSLLYRELAGLEKLTIPYKLEYLTLLDVTKEPFTGLKSSL